jgi:translation initiation factor 2-alpha kinase 4
MPLPMSKSVPTLMEQKTNRDTAKRQVSSLPCVSCSSNAPLQAEEEAARLETAREAAMIEQQGHDLELKLREEEARRDAEVRQHEAEERQRRERERGALNKRFLPVGALEDRKVSFPGPRVVVGDTGVACNSWMAYGAGTRDGLWMTYDVEGDVGEANGFEYPGSAAKRKIPVCSLQVIEFAAAYYTTMPGQKRIDGVFGDLENLVTVRHPNLATIYAVKVRPLYLSRFYH